MLDISLIKGLSQKEAEEKLIKDGFNELPNTKQKRSWQVFLEVIKEPMFLLLIACGLLYFLLSDIKEAMVLMLSMVVIIGITFYQEQKTEKALAELKNLSSPRALVLRDGEKRRIAGREVVSGDIIFINEGDRIPADAKIIESNNFIIDESLLTGESVPVKKDSSENNLVFSGTMAVAGQALAQVIKIGINTELGKIGKALEGLKPEQTYLQRQTASLVKVFAFYGGFLSIFIFVVYALTRHEFINGMLAGLSLAMSILPEEFPVIMTVFLALGAWRISKNNVLTRRIPAVENLGAITALCTDKTGTITENKMEVQAAWLSGKKIDLHENINSADFSELIEYGFLASRTNPFDPMEKAIRELNHKYNKQNSATLLKEFSLSDKLTAMSNVWDADEKKVVAAKGSPEAIISLCHLEGADAEMIERGAHILAGDGLRVLGIARAEYGKDMPEDQHDFNFKFLGLIGLADPIRKEVPQAIKECKKAGIKVIMITGDYPETARIIGERAGLSIKEKIITGKELDKMSEMTLKEEIRNTRIFARIAPEQKLKIVQALKANGEVVAMTGDGVNDAPALKAADVGIAMGGRGTDVARESASLVLLDDNFASIAKAIKTGRRIYDNIKKAVSYVFVVHFPIACLAVMPVVLNWPLVLLPIHIVFLELIIDPACSIVFEMEKEEKNLMNRPPRPINSKLFSKNVFIVGFAQGVSGSLAVMAAYFIAIYKGLAVEEVRTFSFITLVLINLGLILINRSRKNHLLNVMRIKNPALIWIVGGTLVVLIFSVITPQLRNLLHFGKISLLELSLCFFLAVVSIIFSEVFKIIRFRSL